MTTDFVRKLIMQNDLESVGEPCHDHPEINQKLLDQTLSQYFNHDLILLPFFFDDINAKTPSDNHEHIYHTNPET